MSFIKYIKYIKLHNPIEYKSDRNTRTEVIHIKQILKSDY